MGECYNCSHYIPFFSPKLNAQSFVASYVLIRFSTNSNYIYFKITLNEVFSNLYIELECKYLWIFVRSRSSVLKFINKRKKRERDRVTLFTQLSYLFFHTLLQSTGHMCVRVCVCMFVLCGFPKQKHVCVWNLPLQP